MNEIMQVRIDKSLADVLENVREIIAIDLKHKYHLDRITIHGSLASKVLAAQMRGVKHLKFRINKTGSREGILDIIG